jgi:ribonuclease HI
MATATEPVMAMSSIRDDSQYVIDAMNEYNFRHSTSYKAFSEFSTSDQSWVLRRAHELKFGGRR